ncbi:hypothetical protein AWENTII_005997 [Aspergillus wentii]
MKLALPFLFALAGIHSAIAQSSDTCEADANTINQSFTGAPYNEDVSSLLSTEDIRVIHFGDEVTLDSKPSSYRCIGLINIKRLQE